MIENQGLWEKRKARDYYVRLDRMFKDTVDDL